MKKPLEFITKEAWQRVGVRHHHGIALALSSLHSAHSGGIGEYTDLLPILSWLKTTGFTVVQLLPLNDTGSETSPYMALSANALHPIYLCLKQLKGVEQTPQVLEIHKQLHSLTSRHYVDYATVLKLKLQALWIYLDAHIDEIQNDPAFQLFTQQHADWLTSYSIFRAMKDAHDGKAWWDWNIANPHALALSEETILREIFKWRAVQYLCFSQMGQVRQAALDHGILLVGDVPILINKDSADVWWHQHLFSLKTTVGAAPDMYCKEGQSWGFPLYLWKAHKKDNYAWWRKRLHVQQELYDLFRLDHLVGFYRLFAIKPQDTASNGHFVPATPEEWISLGEDILQHLIESTTMLPLAEDLGHVPDIVRASMHTLGIPGLKVMRWERNWQTDCSFIHPRYYSPESVTTVSTHDSSTLAGFFEEHPLDAKRMLKDYRLAEEDTFSVSTAKKLLKLAHQSGSLFHINLLVEYTNLFHDLSNNDPNKDRINIPGTVSHTNWTRRIKPSVETLISHADLADLLRELSTSKNIELLDVDNPEEDRLCQARHRIRQF